jgi:K+-sensing histidine kinase KdpD
MDGTMRFPARSAEVLGWLTAVAGPALLTFVLVHLRNPEQRDYVFLYLAVVAVLGVLSGLWPAVAAAALSFLQVDFFFVPPFGTFTIADEQDVVNLLAFFVTAGMVGLLASQRRRALLHAEALTRNLRQSNTEPARLNKEQAAAAQAALRLARSQEQIRALQEVDRSRRELLANVSHELRTPLGTILAESTSPVTAADRVAELERRQEAIAGEAQRLKLLVSDMLDLAVIEAGTLELRLEPVRLADAIEAAVERLHRTSPGRTAGRHADPRRGRQGPAGPRGRQGPGPGTRRGAGGPPQALRALRARPQRGRNPSARRGVRAPGRPRGGARPGEVRPGPTRDRGDHGHRRRRRWRPWDTTGELIRLLQGVDIHVLRRQH